MVEVFILGVAHFILHAFEITKLAYCLAEYVDKNIAVSKLVRCIMI